MALGAPAPSFSGSANSLSSSGHRFRPGGGNRQPSNPYDPFYRGQVSQIGLDFGVAQAQANRAAAEAPIYGAQANQAQQGLTTNFDISNRRIGLQEAGLGIDRGANARNRAYYDSLLGINASDRGLTEETFANQIAQLQAAHDQNVRSADSQATAAGAWLGSGRGQAITDSRGEMERGRTSADISRRGSLNSLEAQRLGYQKNRDETNDADAKLDLVAAGYGLDREKLKADLDQGLSDLGFDRFIKTRDLIDRATSPYASISGPAMDVIAKAMQAGSVFNSGALGNYYSSLFGG